MSVDHWTSPGLPYADSIVNVLHCRGADDNLRKEIMRVLCPGGTAKIGMSTIRKPWPEGIDHWTHPRHGADGNQVSDDTEADVPHRIRWIAGMSLLL